MNSALQTTTQAVDPVFVFILGISVAILAGITATVLWFVIRYRRSRAPEPTSAVASNIRLEIVWTTVSTLLALAMFWYGWEGYLALRTMPKDALQVKATARMWSWSFGYGGGQTSSKLFVPVGKPVRVELVTEDVLHGFYLPAFRVKQDVVPGRTTEAWFVATEPGTYDLFCSVYCGAGHSAMITTVEALPPEQFASWLHEAGEKKEEAGEHAGEELLEKHGCLACHSLDGSPKVGPTFKGIGGRQVTVITDGKERTIPVDEAYLRRSIREPKADIVKGFPPAMPPFPTLTEEEIKAMVTFLEGVK